MDLATRFALDGVTLASWGLQLALILWVLLPGTGRVTLPRIPLAAGLLVVAAGWIWRLVYSFALASGGLRFWIGDDAVRWLRAWQWSQEPFLYLPGDAWLVGPYVLHGSMMAWVGDPLIATRLLASALCVLPLLGTFLLAQALFRSAAVSACAVALTTPHWLHVLLGTGTMTEIPVTGLLLGGIACQIFALREAPPARGLQWIGAGCLALATSLHVTAWIYVAAAQIVLGAVALRSSGGSLRSRLLRWAGPAALSGVFCAGWLLALWWQTGHPLSQFQQVGDITIFRYGRPGHRIWNAPIYPAALLYVLWLHLPLAAFGVIRPFFAGGDRAARAIVLGVGLALLALAATAGPGTNVTPFRTVLPLAAILVPLSIAALFRESPDRPRGPRFAVGIGLAIAVLVAHTAQHHAGAFAHRRLSDVAWTKPGMKLPESMDLADTFALGAWFRREFAGPRILRPENLSQPIRLFVGADHPYHWFEWLFLQYAIGDPGRLAFEDRPIHAEPKLAAELRALAPHQLLVSNRRVRNGAVVPVLRIGRYWIYAGRAPQERVR